MTSDTNKSSEALLLQIAEGTAQKVGDDFHRSLIETLRRVMDVSIAVITRGVGHPPSHAQTLYAWRDGDSVQSFEYELEGTPCALVYNDVRVTVPCDLTKNFPRENGLESYCGVPLHDKHGAVTGHFAVFSDHAFEDERAVENIMRIFASRVEAEIQRAYADRERDALIRSLKRSSDRMELQREAARAANSFKSDVLAMTVHDLRNPLTAIMNRAELIETYSGDQTSFSLEERQRKSAESARAIIQNSERMEKMIVEVLRSSRANATSLSHEPATFDLCKMLTSIIALNEEIAAKKSIFIKTDLPTSLLVEADEDRLIEGVDNILSNAIKFSEPNTKICVCAHEMRGMTTIEVIDEGIGLSPSDLTTIFEQYQASENNERRDDTSYGLGLWIVKTIAERHGGRVRATSDGRGKGSTFSISIPSRNAILGVRHSD